MAGEAAAEGEVIMLDAASGRVTQSARVVYLVLLTAAPNDATTMATMTELTTPATNGYDREIVVFDLPAGDPSETENDSLITFGPFTSDLANVTHVGLVSALTGTGGDFVWYWTADVAKDPANGDSITIAAGAITMTCD